MHIKTNKYSILPAHYIRVNIKSDISKECNSKELQTEDCVQHLYCITNPQMPLFLGLNLSFNKI